MSASQAKLSPELAELACNKEDEVAELRKRLDAFPQKAGTMYGIVKDKLQLAEQRLARAVDEARKAAAAIDDIEELELKQRAEELEKQLEEVLAATEIANDNAAAASSEWGDQRVRLQADFDNLQARVANQTSEAQIAAGVKLLGQFLPVLDNFDRARASVQPEGDEAEATSRDYEELHASLMGALAEMGVEKIATVGEPFDYNLHMAIQTVPSDEYDEDHVASELQAGFLYKGELVRPAYVAVSSG